MAIRTKTAKTLNHMHLIFPPHPRAAEFCQGNGIEFGAAAHNPFHLPGSINVAPGDDSPIYEQAQAEMCGQAALIDIEAEAHAVPLPDASQDYIISSHVIEHLPDPISAFFEWSRLLKPGGTIFMIVPKRDAHPPDKQRPISKVGEFQTAFMERYTSDTHPYQAQGRRGHYWVFTLESMIDLIDVCNSHYGLHWERVYDEETDAKVGNGFTLVYRYEPEDALMVEDVMVAVSPEAIDEALDTAVAGDPESFVPVAHIPKAKPKRKPRKK